QHQVMMQHGMQMMNGMWGDGMMDCCGGGKMGLVRTAHPTSSCTRAAEACRVVVLAAADSAQPRWRC
ncbi:hypothetical protein ACPA1U_16775, partial [Ectopseudomonas hydrolytica]